MKHLLLSTILLMAFAGTNQGQSPQFREAAAEAGIDPVGTNHGVSFGDMNNDLYDDLYVALRGQPNRLYRNNGDGTFEDISAAAGVDHDGEGMMSVWGDFDNDGWNDLYVANRNQPNVLYHNNGDGTFRDISIASGTADKRVPQGLALADVNNDGWLDIYVANLGTQNVLYRNNGDLTFTDVAVASGATDEQIAMGIVFFDYDNDGDQDLYLTHDAHQPFILYQNDGTGNFTDVSEAAGVNYAAMGMGVDVADFNRDGHLDFYVTNLGPNVLFSNNGDGTFTNVYESAGIGDGGMGWGTVWMDYDNDGWPDLYVTNDYKFTPSPNLLYRNQRDGTFLDVAPGTDLESRLAGYGCATADVDLNGFLDLVVANLTQENQLFLNETSNGHHWLALHLEGTQSNRSAVGSRITVYAGNESYLREVRSGSGFAAQQSHWQHFGLMLNAAVDSVVIRWPNGTVEQFTDLEVDRFYRVTEGGSAALAFPPTSADEPMSALAIQAVASPNPFSDQVQFQVNAPAGTAWQLTVSDVTGREVFSESMRAGNGQPWAWSGTDQHGNPVPNGVYFYRLSSADQVLSGKLVRQR